MMNPIELSTTRKKDREGLPGRVARFATGDYQQGHGGEGVHWWLLITDVEIMPDGRVHLLVVFEGKLWTDTDLVETINRHDVAPVATVLDSSWDDTTSHVYQLAFRHGYSCLKGAGGELFNHPDKSRKIYSAETPLHKMMGNHLPKYDYVFEPNPDTRELDQVPDAREPMFWRYNKAGIMERALWVRTSKECWLEIPSDVSEEFKEAFDSWSCEQKQIATTGEIVPVWKQHRDNDHLWQCLCYAVMMMEKYGIIGTGEFQTIPTTETETK